MLARRIKDLAYAAHSRNIHKLGRNITPRGSVCYVEIGHRVGPRYEEASIDASDHKLRRYAHPSEYITIRIVQLGDDDNEVPLGLPCYRTEHC